MQKFDRLQWEQVNFIFASEGQRVIAFAYKDVANDTLLTHDRNK